MQLNWKTFYKQISDKNWPDCQSFHDMINLPDNIQKEIIFQHLAFLFEEESQFENSKDKTISVLAKTPQECFQLCNKTFPDYFHDDKNLELELQVMCGEFLIKYHSSMELGGILRAPLFLEILKKINKSKKYNHCLEWCSGPGFIGYTILSEGICERLDLADIWKPGLDAAKLVKTKHPVNTWHIRKLSDIQPMQSYDLVVGNPPWFPGNLLKKNRLYSDPGLQIVKQFFHDVKNYLSKDGIIVLIQGQKFTGPGDYWQMIDESGLEMCQVFDVGDDWHWFMVVKHKI